MSAEKTKKEPTFEETLTELETIVAQLEKGENSLEDSMKMYENGVQLTAKLNRSLKAAKLKIEELKTADGK